MNIQGVCKLVKFLTSRILDDKVACGTRAVLWFTHAIDIEKCNSERNNIN